MRCTPVGTGCGDGAAIAESDDDADWLDDAGGADELLDELLDDIEAELLEVPGNEGNFGKPGKVGNGGIVCRSIENAYTA